MILKRMDETILAGQYDLEDSDEVTVVLIAPELKMGSDNKLVADWHEVDRDTVSKKILFYDDTADPSNTLFRSWQNFYQSGNSLAKGNQTPFAGCSSMFKNGLPCFGGIAKAAAYMKYSKGFAEYLGTFDPGAAKLAVEENEIFRRLLDDNGKIPQNWLGKYKPDKGSWPLPILTKLSTGQYLVLGLNNQPDSSMYEELEDLQIDITHSLEVMAFLQKIESSEREMLLDLFQMSTGLGRNAFGKAVLDSGTTEYLRLMGNIPESGRTQILDFWKNRAEYRIKFAPNPDNSSLLFLPDAGLDFSELKKHIDNENRRKEHYFALKQKKQGKANDDLEAEKVQRPSMIPVNRHAGIFLVNVEGSQKRKLIVQQFIPSVSVRYFAALNEELLNSNLQYALVNYMKSALTGQDRDTPSVYVFWTGVFTRALQKQCISARPVYEKFQSFVSTMSGEKLIKNRKAAQYFSLIGKMLRLALLIDTAKRAPELLGTPDFALQLNKIETFQIISKQGVFGTMTTENVPSGVEILGESYSFLRDYEKQKFDSFVRQAFSGVPGEDFKIFCRGALTGMLLQILCWCVTNAGRRFTVTQGRHPSRLRGAEITALFVKGIGLLQNLDKSQLFNNRMLPFIKSVEEESRRDSFNSGMIMGMVYSEPKGKDGNSGNNDQSTDKESNEKL